jgi:hypothetical protein
MTASDYLSELVSYGGEVMSRGEMIADLQKTLGDPAMVDRYLQGHDLAQQLREKREPCKQ